MVEELKAVSAAIRKVSNEFWDFQNQERYYGSEEYYKEKIEYHIKTAYLTILAVLDKHNYSGLRDYLSKAWLIHSADLLDAAMSEVSDEPFLKVVDNLFWPIYTALENIGLNKAEDTVVVKELTQLKNIFERMPHAALNLGYLIDDEAKLDKFMDAYLTTLYPDLNSNPALTLPHGYRQPDSASTSLNTLFEYKYINSKAGVSKAIDELQSDIRNYYQEPWEYLYIVIGMNDYLLTQTKIERTLLKEPTSFKKIYISLLRF